MGKSRYRVLEHGVGVKWDPRRTAAYVPSHFMVLNPIFCYVSPKIVIFHEPLIVETRNKCHWIQHALNPKYVPLKQFQCIFPVKINKMWNFGCFLNSPWQKNWKKHQFAQGKSVCKGLQICKYKFMSMLIIMHYVRTLCDKYILSYYGFSAFLWEGLDIGFWNMV